MDTPLRQKTCRLCHRVFAICVACDRGHAYCSPECRAVAQVLAQEQPRLLPLPAHPFATDVMRAVVSGKTPYARFDRNSYSIPHPHVRRPLTLLASVTTVRLVAGTETIAHHARSYDTGQTIEDLAHLDGLLAATRQANAQTARDRLRLAVPLTATFFERLAVPARRRNAGVQWS